MPSPPRNRPGYLPSLDGWRAIAILGVLLVHDVPLTVRGVSIEGWQRFGSEGVVLFFAISGLLICSRILEEEELTGRFHLKLFYIRRVFRIQPAALVYLAVIAVLTLLGILHEHWKYWLGGIFLYENFLYDPNASVAVANASFFSGHFWTLAVEEHFYLLISLAIFFFRKRRLLIFATALVLIKLTQIVAMHHTPDPLLRRTYWQIHMLLWPSVAAMALRRSDVRAWALRWLQPRWVFLVSGVGLVILYEWVPTRLVTVLEYSFTLWVIATMLHPQSWATRALEWGPLRFIGRISYSLYLWHVLFFFRNSQVEMNNRLLNFLSYAPWKYVASLVVATASFYLIEKPMVRLGHKLAPPATAGHKDLNDLPTLPRVRDVSAAKET